MKNRRMMILFTLVVATVLFALITFKPQAQDRTKLQNEQQQDDEATVVQRGQVTDKEREYSKEYKKMYSYRKGRKFSELIELSERLGKKNEELGGYLGEHEAFFLPNAPAITTAEFLRNLSCTSDVIVLGSVKSKSSHMTEDETFIYTEYDFSVEDILKDNSSNPVEINKSIEITRPGGLIKLDNRRIRIQDLSYEPLQKNKRYLLFLRFLPSANGYIVASPEGDFVLEDNSFKKLSKRALPEELKGGDNSQTLLNAVRNSASSDCSQNMQGGNQ